jgi:hypothetical protein
MTSKLEFGELAESSLLFLRGRWEEDGGGTEVAMVSAFYVHWQVLSQIRSSLNWNSVSLNFGPSKAEVLHSTHFL